MYTLFGGWGSLAVTFRHWHRPAFVPPFRYELSLYCTFSSAPTLKLLVKGRFAFYFAYGFFSAFLFFGEGKENFVARGSEKTRRSTPLEPQRRNNGNYFAAS
ncbi:unnamed protein product [Amoebophrya sp. A120]|nr:unnamed protein product [Amoebophrya sp. A120]|eukprot:GSA120T00012824001.1